MPYKDKDAKKQYNKKYYEKQRDILLEQKKDYYVVNRDKIKSQKRTYNKEQRKLIRDRKLKKQFGITLEQYDLMLEKQNGLCAICSEPPTDKKALAVDHNHVSGKIRSLLCMRCNLAIGMFEERKDLLIKAMDYLNKYDSQ